MGVLRTVAILALATVVVAGCGPAAPSPDTSGRATSPVLSAPVTLTRSGGIAGVNDTITVDSGGAWTFRDRTGKILDGHLSEAQRAELAALLADPSVGREARQAPANPPCMDAFVYHLSAGGLDVQGADCGDLGRRYPGLAKIVTLLTDVTPM
ncbi:MAG TPA: hypothetical protein VF054_03430 [Micromonosporaceae bacterium]